MSCYPIQRLDAFTNVRTVQTRIELMILVFSSRLQDTIDRESNTICRLGKHLVVDAGKSAWHLWPWRQACHCYHRQTECIWQNSGSHPLQGKILIFHPTIIASNQHYNLYVSTALSNFPSQGSQVASYWQQKCNNIVYIKISSKSVLLGVIQVTIDRHEGLEILDETRPWVLPWSTDEARAYNKIWGIR